MHVREVFQLFTLEDYTDHNGWSRDLSNYWEMEEKIADRIGAPFSAYDKDSQLEDRTCAICGFSQGTSQHGKYPSECKTPECAEVRKYFNIHGYSCRLTICVFNGLRKEVVNAQQFLRSMLHRDGHKTLTTLEQGFALQYLLSIMLERVVFEKRTSSGEFSEDLKNVA